ncbi:hypothetical protein GKZ90_0010285 [Flavobacterium sp. MC2016-06]|jgi:hypothetical protein|uniref:hypothetical protein n=1 Tax=Flavobacterium sp. MC2016-06 TaxID=2676308 RepID=UPI0018AC95DE|nr:hypothetical protein [Flavobacterium sp. MC2016-06]MBU3858487.1 hypothetical protein [Flavobacterium sp. MC2016-06]
MMKKFLFYFAFTGWCLGLIVHLLSLADIDVTEKAPFVWLLHIGIFVVWLPIVLDLKNNEELQAYQQSGILNRIKPMAFYKIVFKETPTWMAIIAIGGFFYAVINFMLFMFSQIGTPDIKNGQFILQNHGQLIKTLTEQEYHHYKANEVRGFSGHWIAFYGIATAFLYKFSRQKNQIIELEN